jgi:hypothetical protein
LTPNGDFSRTAFAVAGEVATLNRAGFIVLSRVFQTRVVMLAVGHHDNRTAVMEAKRSMAFELQDRSEASIVGLTFAERRIPTRAPVGRICVELVASALPVIPQMSHTPTHPFRTTIDGAGVVQLLNNGWRPLDVIFASTKHFAHHSTADMIIKHAHRNGELVGINRMISGARIAVRDMIASDAKALGADGVLFDGEIDADLAPDLGSVIVSAICNAVIGYPAGKLTHRPGLCVPLSTPPSEARRRESP